MRDNVQGAAFLQRAALLQELAEELLDSTPLDTAQAIDDALPFIREVLVEAIKVGNTALELLDNRLACRNCVRLLSELVDASDWVDQTLLFGHAFRNVATQQRLLLVQ